MHVEKRRKSWLDGAAARARSQLRWLVPTYSPEERALLLGNALRRRLVRSEPSPLGSDFGALAA